MVTHMFFLIATNFSQIFTEEWFHFLSSSIIGLAVYFAVSAILTKTGWQINKGFLKVTVDSLSFNIVPFVLGLAGAWCIHILIDGAVAWYTTPLATALAIVK